MVISKLQKVYLHRTGRTWGFDRLYALCVDSEEIHCEVGLH
jgi:hypothetical protein